MNRFLSPWFSLLKVLVLAAVLWPGLMWAQEGLPQTEQVGEGQQPTQKARTVGNSDISLEQLRVLFRPMTREELEVEQAAWLGLLQNQITEVGKLEIQLHALTESGDEKDDPKVQKLKEQLVALRTEEVELYLRMETLIDSLKAKGGDVAATEQYLAAVSDLGASGDSDSKAAAVVAAARAWMQSPQGGKLFAKRAGVALVILLVFWVLSKYAGRLVAKALTRRSKVSTLLTDFAKRVAGGLTLLVGVLIAVSTLGVQLGPLMAALGAGGFIIGFALQETLANFASGLMIMIYRPFDVSDYVAMVGVEGTVKEMSLVSTTLLTFDNKVLIIPNKAVWSDTITNYTGRKLRRVDLVFGIGYDDDIPQAMEVLKEVAAAHALVLKNPSLTVEVLELGDSSVNIGCRPWVKTGDYWPVFWELTKEVKMRFDKEGISIPFPQRDVHLIPVEGDPGATSESQTST